jgi:hypothetical protein
MGILAVFFDTDFTNLAAYFISLTGFVAAYIFGESVRKSLKSSIFLPGKLSRREAMVYVIILLWTIIGVFVIIKNGDLIGMSSYFAALTPFVGSYIIGETYKEDDDYTDPNEDYQINS